MKKTSIILLSIILLSACQNTKHKQDEKENLTPKASNNSYDPNIYKKKGKEIAQATFKAFVGHIKAKSQEGGLTAVVDFCHDNAMKLTDSMSNVYGVKIKRTSHKLRNPKNAPDEMEKKILEVYLSDKKENKKLQPIVEKDQEGNIHFYAPITIKHDCLQCHGEPVKDIPEPIYNKIKEKYPEDQAIHFKLGDLRGIWDIKFPKENK
jgi:hypothetical protein